MNNKKRRKKKGHVLIEIGDVGVGPRGGGTSTAPATCRTQQNIMCQQFWY